MALKTRGPTKWTSAAARRVVEAAGGGLSVEDAVVRIVAVLREGTYGPPTQLDVIRERLRVEPWQPQPLPVSGELRRNGERLTIAYASGLSLGRRRFTIAHELGHAFFERSGPNCPRRGKELERICDLFAVELLMPREQTASVVDDPGPRSVLTLADRFEVSLTAAMYRYTEVARTHAAIDDGARRSATLAALAQPDESVQRLVDDARLRGEADEVMPLNRNPVWNGPWWIRAAAAGKSPVVVMTGQPLVSHQGEADRAAVGFRTAESNRTAFPLRGPLRLSAEEGR